MSKKRSTKRGAPGLTPTVSFRSPMVVALISLMIAVGGYLIYRSFASYPRTVAGVGTTIWFPNYPAGYDSLEWTMTPLHDPSSSLQAQGLLHYYAFEFGMTNGTGGQVGSGYAGFQTNGLWAGNSMGKVINYSISGSNGCDTSNPQTLSNPNNTEFHGCQLMLPYSYAKLHPYAFQLKEGPRGIDNSGKWWGLWVTDTTSGRVTYVGEERVPVQANGKPSAKLNYLAYEFNEDTHWWLTNSYPPKIYPDCSQFQNSAIKLSNVTANSGAVHPSSMTYQNSSNQVITNTISTPSGPKKYNFLSCNVSIYADANFNAQFNVGTWSPPATQTVKPYSRAPQPTALTFGAVQDTYTLYDRIQNRPGIAQHGGQQTVDVDYAPAGCSSGTACDLQYTRRGYLKFAVSGIRGKVQSVHLRIFSTTSIEGTINVFPALSNAWFENTLIWPTQPAYNPQFDLAHYSTGSGNVAGAYLDIPLSLSDGQPVATDGTYSFVVGTTTANILSLSSKEGGHPPQLIVTYQ